MFRGFYTAASGMISQQRRTEILTNNLANVNTPGYKADQTALRAFPEMLIERLEKTTLPGQKIKNIPQMRLVGPLNTGVYLQETIPNFKQGDLVETGFTTDIALQNIDMPVTEDRIAGTVFFTVEDPNGGVHYTRNGNFTLDGAGFLTTASGQYILDVAGNRIQLENDQFQVTDDGWIIQEGVPVARLQIAFAENPQQLMKDDEGYYRTGNGQALPSAYDQPNVFFALRQNHIERSNVDLSQTMTEMLMAYRAFEANQKIVQAYDRSMEKAVNEIGKIG